MQVRFRFDEDGVVNRVQARGEDGMVWQVGVTRAAGGEGVGQVEREPQIRFADDAFFPGCLLRGKTFFGSNQVALHLLDARAEMIHFAFH